MQFYTSTKKTNEIYIALPSVKSMSKTLVGIGLMLGVAKIKYITLAAALFQLSVANKKLLTLTSRN